MSKVKLNKKSVKQQGGAMIPSQPAMSNQQPVVDPMIQQVTEIISSSVNQGKDIVDIVLELSQQQVDQQVIAQALMMGGMQQEDIMTLFQQVSVKAQPPGPSSPEEVNSSPQLLARNEALESSKPKQDTIPGFAKSGIEIEPENRGKFTRWAKARGMSVSEAYNKVMDNTDAYPTSVVKMANFAKNAAGWKKEEGGEFKPHMMYKGDDGVMAMTHDQHLELGEKGYIHLAENGGGMDYTEGVRQREGSYNPPNRKYTLDSRFRDYGGEPRSFMEWYGSKATGDEIGMFIDNPTQYSKPVANNSYNMGDFFQNINPEGNILLEGLGLASDIKQELFSKEVGENNLKKGAFAGLKDKVDYASTASPLYYGKKTTYDLSDENLKNIEDYKALTLAEEEEKQRKLKSDYDNNISEASGIVPELMDQESYFQSIGLDKDNKMMGSDFNQKLYDQYLESYNKTYPKLQEGGGGPFTDEESEVLEFLSDGTPFDMANYTISNAEGMEEVDPVIADASTEGAVNNVQTAADVYSKINMPESERTNSLAGMLTEIGDNPFFRIGTSLSKVGVDAASFANDNIYNRINQEKAKEDRQDMFMADNWASVVTDAPGSKGNYKTNTGMLRSTKDRVVGLDEATFNPFMTSQFSKKGGGVNNDGFKALPPNVQHNILTNMASGGEESYLANRDRVIKAAIAEQDKAKDGNKEYKKAFNNAGGNFSKKETKSIIENMIKNHGFNSDNDTIISSGSYKPLAGRTRALNNNMYEAGFDGNVDYNNIFDIIPNSPFTMDQVSFMSIPKNQKGGETVNVDSTLLAKLIAAGNDIEML